MKNRYIIGILILFCLSLYSGDLSVIKAGKLLTTDGSYLSNSIIVFEGGIIKKVGKNIEIPDNARIYDYSKYIVYPGLINSYTFLGLSDISSISVWSDYREAGEFNPHIKVFTALYPWGKLLPITRDFGTLVILSAPAGGTISGKASLVKLSGWTPSDMIIDKHAALIVNIPEAPLRRGGKDKKALDTSKKQKELTEFFNKAYKYWLRKNKNISQKYNLKYEEMLEVFNKNIPVICNVNRKNGINYAIELSKKYNFKIILRGLYEGEESIDLIKKSEVPVILTSLYTSNRKWEDGYDKVYKLPAKLSEAGIKFAFSTSYASSAFDLPMQAGRACAYGLTQEQAKKALTIYPAEILGLKEYGSIEAGKRAAFVIANGNILETSTNIKAVFLEGKKIEMEDYFKKEYEETRNRIVKK